MILTIGAMDGEISACSKAISNSSTHHSISGTRLILGTLEGWEVALGKSGVGKAMSALCAQSMIEYLISLGKRPRALVFTGLAGALNPQYEIGDTVVSRDCVQHDLNATELGIPLGTVPYSPYRFLTADPVLVAAMMSFSPAAGVLREGRILTGDQFISRRDEPRYEYLRKELNGDAVEMEGAAVALCATVNNIPFLLIRTISDKSDGSAAVKFSEFLPIASENSLMALRHLLRNLD